jgi:hypothetical protein
MGMWPFPEPSYLTATRITDLASWFLIGSMLVGVLSAYAIVQMGNIKEYHLDRERELSRERIAQLELRTAEANQKAEQERQARIKIEQRMVDRDLSPPQQRTIANKLRQFSSAGQKVEIFGIAEVSDVEKIGNSLASALILAGWKLHGLKGSAVSRRVFSGIVVESDPDETFQSAARALVSALKDEELDVSGPESIKPLGAAGTFAGQPLPDAKIRITIGPKF